MKKNYTRFVDENVNINKLIQTLDTNMDRVLSKGEFRALLSVRNVFSIKHRIHITPLYTLLHT